MKVPVIPDVHLKPKMFYRASAIMRQGKADRAVTLNEYTHLGLHDAIAGIVRMGAMTAKEEDSVCELRTVKKIYLTKTAKIYQLPEKNMGNFGKI